MFSANLTFEWYDEPIVFPVLIFILCFRTNAEIGHFNENDFHTLIVVFFRKIHFESDSVTAMFKVPSQQL